MITSNSNPKIKHVAQLIKSAKDRKAEGVYVVEGIKMVREAPFMMVSEIYMSESFAANHDEEFAKYVPETVSDSVFAKMSDTKTPQGILCVVNREDCDVNEWIDSHKKGDLKVLILEGIQDPGNLGTMLRSAEGAGFDAIIADAKTVDVYNPKVIRSTMGSIFRIPVLYTEDLTATCNKLKDSGVTLYAAHLSGTKNYNEIDYSNRRGILIGNESNGLSDEISALADVKARIPMSGKVESLNAAVAATLFMYENHRKEGK